MNTDVMFSSETDNWATPQDFFDKLNEKYNFNLDPCADEKNHKCNNFFTKEKNGLKQPWSLEYGIQSKVFCNPPYGKVLKDWVAKASAEIKQSYCDLIVMLIPARTDTRYFHEYIYKKENVEIEFLKGRLIFGTEKYWEGLWEQEFIIDEKGKSKKNPIYKKYGKKNSAPFPSMLVIFKKHKGPDLD